MGFNVVAGSQAWIEGGTSRGIHPFRKQAKHAVSVRPLANVCHGVREIQRWLLLPRVRPHPRSFPATHEKHGRAVQLCVCSSADLIAPTAAFFLAGFFFFAASLSAEAPASVSWVSLPDLAGACWRGRWPCAVAGAQWRRGRGRKRNSEARGGSAVHRSACSVDGLTGQLYTQGTAKFECTSTLQACHLCRAFKSIQGVLGDLPAS